MIKLDLKDKKLLYQLDINSRQSYKEIGKKIGLSKDAVSYRIKQLQEEGIIRQFHTVIDVGKLGLISFRLYLKFQNTNQKKESEIIEFIKKQKNIPWCASFDGEYDLGIWVLVKSIKEMNSFWKELLDKYLNYISKKSLTIFTKVSYFPRVYLLEGRNNDKEYVFITEPEKANIDSKDIEILQLLAPNARIPLLEIAEKLNMTPKTVASRIKELQRKKVIIGYRTRFDLDKLSYQYFKLHINLHNITKEKEDNLRNYFFTHPNIIYDNRVLGGDDIEIEIQVKSLQDLRKIIADIKSSFSDIIQDYHYFLIYKEHKALFLVSDV